jgi:hypothetical protein
MPDLPRYWKPLVKIRLEDFQPIRQEIIAETMDHYGVSEDEARARLEAEHGRCSYYLNAIYQVQVDEVSDGVTHLCIRRRDGAADLRDWRHFQQIKNELCGEEREAVELYPAESRKVDTSNKWHLWVLPLGTTLPVGWTKRDVKYDESRDVPGMRQRPL